MSMLKTILRKVAGRLPVQVQFYLERLYRKAFDCFGMLYVRLTGQGWPAGHFYSPLPDFKEIKRSAPRLFLDNADMGESLNINEDVQTRMIENLRVFFDDFDWTLKPSPGRRYYLENGFFMGADALLLYSMLRHFRPQRVVEIGAGFSSVLMLDVNERFLNGSVEFTFIEPNPDRLKLLLNENDLKHCTIIPARIQEASLDVISGLSANDILFVDSSHVAKVGSDVNYILFELLPRLPKGTLVHFHDIPWPFEYPERWVVQLRWAWNEAYMLRAFLQYNEAFEIVLFNSWISRHHSPEGSVASNMFQMYEGSSLWVRRVS